VRKVALLDDSGRRLRQHVTGKPDTVSLWLANAEKSRLVSWKLRQGEREVHSSDQAIHAFRGSAVVRLPLDKLQLAIGTYQLGIMIDGRLQRELTLVVASEHASASNRPPHRPLVGRLQKTVDGAAVIWRCHLVPRIDGEDPDLDSVRYRYRWTLAGKVMRDVLSLAGTDVLALPENMAGLVQCEVRADDGTLRSEAAIANGQ